MKKRVFKNVLLFGLILCLGFLCEKIPRERTVPVSAPSAPAALPGEAISPAVGTPSPAPSETPKEETKPKVPESKKEPIPKTVRKKMQGVSMPKGATVSFDDLSYLTIPYYDYKGNVKTGHMIVDKTLADEILEIFEELFSLKFPIAQMTPIDEFSQYIDDTYDTLDHASMAHNNTSSFCYRSVPGKDSMSLHSYGRAIDINPLTNPYHIPSKNYFTPANAEPFLDRTQNYTGKISHGDPVYNAFISRGWTWGGDWKNEKDYQHFQKKK